MHIELKLELCKALEKWSSKTSDNINRSDTFFTDDLLINMASVAELIYDQNAETQEWLKKEGHLK